MFEFLVDFLLGLIEAFIALIELIVAFLVDILPVQFVLLIIVGLLVWMVMGL